MQYGKWLRPAFRLGAAGALALTASMAVAQDPPRVPAPPTPARERPRLDVEIQNAEPRDNVFFIAEDDGFANDVRVVGELAIKGGKQSEYWVGVECRPMDETVRVQLGLQDAGLVVDQVMPDSPAAKAEVKPQDILLSVNDKPLKSVQDLIAVLEETKDKELKFNALRGGKPTTINVTPAKRPEGQARGEGGEPRQVITRWLNAMQPQPGKGPVRMQFLHPGLVLPPGAPGQTELPEDVTVTLRKEGRKLATIEVKRGDKNWNTTEDKLSDLPDDVRVPVEGWLGRGPGRVFNIKLPEPGDVIHARTRRLEPQPPLGEGDRAVGQPPRTEGREDGRRTRVLVAPPRVESRVIERGERDANARIEQQLQAMAERLSEMNRDLQALRQQRRGGDNQPPRDTRFRDRDDQDRRERGNQDRRDRGDQDRQPRGPREGEDRGNDRE